MKNTSLSTDVLVIGGGPAGLAAAIAIHNKGFHVIVTDGAKPPIDKACGEGLMPDTLTALASLGVNFTAGQGQPMRGVRFLDETGEVAATFPGSSGLGMRRPVLHQKMIDRAEQLGIKLLWETPVVNLLPSGAIMADGNTVTARWIIGADGAKSRVRRWSGLESYTQWDSRFAYRRHYRAAPWSDCSEVYWGKSAQAYVTQVAANEICLAVVTGTARERIDAALREFPALAQKLSNAEVTTPERGAITSMHKLRRVTRGNVALVGDASGRVDVITGEGLCLSFRQASALADALQARDLSLYQREHRRLARRPSFMAKLMLRLDGRPRFRRRVLQAFSDDPGLFKRVLAVHVGETSAAHMVTTGARFWLRLLTARGLYEQR
ncbi:MAG TPA: FAD-dependent monooxygenase [Candidatus Dormibacteraeota bacterium]|nr:FAD-dependent monooxygenase [Candidatus Dormibacteraeota bacterium]